MDTSETYIKMVNCPQIQELWNPQNGDWYYWNGVLVTEGSKSYLHGLWGTRFKELIWLPRQDQLQAMIGIRGWWIQLGRLYNQVNKWHNEEPDYTQYLESMEQLWLVFVMSQRYQKIWRNGEWVNEQSL